GLGGGVRGERVVLRASGECHAPGDDEGCEQQVVQGRGEQQAAEADVAGGGVADEGADPGVEQGGADGRGDDHDHGAGGRLDLAGLGFDQSGQVADDAQHQGVAAGGVV